MASKRKRKSTNFSLFQETSKKQKNTERPSQPPIPNYILTGTQDDGITQYVFKVESDANLFMDYLKSLNLEDINNNIITNDSNLPNPTTIVNLTPNQLNAWLGPNAYHTFTEVNRLNSGRTLHECANYLCDLEPILANHAALILDKRDNWCALQVAAQNAPWEKFTQLIEKLSPETCNQAALIQGKDQWCLISTIVRNQKGEGVSQFIKKLTGITCNKAALLDNDEGWNAFEIAAWKQDTKEFAPFLNKLTDETCNQLALKTNINGGTIIDGIAYSQDANTLKQFLDRLTPTTCDQLLLLPANDHRDTILTTIASKQNSEQFIAFLNKLSDEPLNKAVLQIENKNKDVTLQNIISAQPLASWDAICKRLSNETCKNAILIQKSNHEAGILELAMCKYHAKGFFNIINRLDQETLDKVLELPRTFGTPLIEEIPKIIGDEAFNELLDRLSPETCAKIVLKEPKSNLDSGFAAIYKSIREPTLYKLLEKIYRDPVALKKVSDRTAHLKTIQFMDGANSSDNWSRITQAILSYLPEAKPRPAMYDIAYAIAHNNTKHPALTPDFLDKTEQYGLRLLRLQGRTILLQDQQGVILAIKVQKENEKRSELIKEYDTTYFLKENKESLHLKSNFPTPVGITPLTGFYDWLSTRAKPEEFQTFKEMVGNNNNRMAYVYKVTPDCHYFTYLHDPSLSDEEFESANEIAINDLCNLLGKGLVFHQLADLFHNKEHNTFRVDKGQYKVLTNILDYVNAGTGRLTGWKEAVAYPNLRASGLADLGDHISINEFIGETKRVKEFFSPTWWNYSSRTANYLLAEQIAKYQYILFLIAGVRGCEITKRISDLNIENKDKLIEKLWKFLALRIVKNCIQAISLLTHQSQADITSTLNPLVNVDRMALQMRYFMHTEYIQDFLQNQVRSDVYGEDVLVSISIDNFRKNTFNDKIGCSIDGVHPDLGPVNGQEPIKEANKLFYWTINQMAQGFQRYRLSLQDLKEIVGAKNLEESEEKRAKAFQYLPPKAYHALQLSLCNTRIAEQSLTPEFKDKLKQEAKSHQENYSALVIQNFWRNNKTQKEAKPDTSPIFSNKMELG